MPQALAITSDRVNADLIRTLKTKQAWDFKIRQQHKAILQRPPCLSKENSDTDSSRATTYRLRIFKVEKVVLSVEFVDSINTNYHGVQVLIISMEPLTT